MKKLTHKEVSTLFNSGAFVFENSLNSIKFRPYVRYYDHYDKTVYVYLPNSITNSIAFLCDKKLLTNISKLTQDEGLILPNFISTIVDFYQSSYATNEAKHNVENIMIDIVKSLVKQQHEQVDVLISQLKEHFIAVLSQDEKYCLPTSSQFWTMQHIEKKQFKNKKIILASEIIANSFENEKDLSLFQDKFSQKDNINEVSFIHYVWLKAAKKLIKPHTLMHLPKILYAMDSLNSSVHQQHIDILEYYRYEEIKPILDKYFHPNVRPYISAEIIQRIKSIYRANGEVEKEVSPLIHEVIEKPLYKKEISLNYQYFQDITDHDADFNYSLIEIMKYYFKNHEEDHREKTQDNKNEYSNYVELSFFNKANTAHFIMLASDKSMTDKFQHDIEVLSNFITSEHFLTPDIVNTLSYKQFGRRTPIEKDQPLMNSFMDILKVGLFKNKLDEELTSNVPQQTTKTRKI